MRVPEKIRQIVHDDETHLVDLTRHFFHRFFDIEFLSDEATAHLDVAQMLAILAVPAIFYTFYITVAYGYVYTHFSWALYSGLCISDQSRYVLFSMVVTGIVAVVEWDRLFPDGRDYTNLMPLPLRVRTIFGAKVTALLLFMGLFVLAVAGPTSLFYPFIEAGGTPHGGSLSHLIWLITAHAVAVFSGCLFMILFFVALQGVLMNLLSYRQFKRASLFVQGVATVFLVCQFFLLPMIPDLLPVWEKTHSPLLYALPPMWFLGLYRTLLGSPNAIFHSLARISVLAFMLSAVIAAVAYLASYKRFSQRAFEWAEEKGASRFSLAALLSWLLDRVWVKEGPERGTFYFVLETLARSARHRLYFVAYVAMGLAIVMIDFLVLMINASHGYHWASITRSGEALLAIPLVISFFTLVGMQAAFGFPAEPRANWIFRITEQDSGRKCMAGARKAMIIVAVVPLFAAGFVVYSELWGPEASLMAMAVGVLVSLILVEPLLYSERKIPFTCTYQPGKSSLPLTGRVTWFAFVLYVLSLASLEKWVFQERAMWVVAVVAGIVILSGIVTHRNRSFASGLGVEFEDKPLPAVQTLDLNA